MNQQQIFTLETFKAWPNPARKMTVHQGSVNEVRDCLRPGLLWTREFYAETMQEARRKGRAVAKKLSEAHKIQYKFEA